MSANRPGRSTATTVTACISCTTPLRRDSATRGRPSASTDATSASSAVGTGAGPGGGPAARGGAGGADEAVNGPVPPRRPGSRAGGQGVRLGERAQQVEDVG